MESQDPGKRKLSQDAISEIRSSKSRKVDDDPSKASTSSPVKCPITAKIISMWQSRDKHTQISQEATDNTMLHQMEEKYRESEKRIKSMKKKLQDLKNHSNKLTQLLQKETDEKQIIINKMNSVSELVQSFSQHINYVTDNLKHMKNHSEELAIIYDEVIQKLRFEKQTLLVELKQLKDQYQQTEKIEEQLQRKQQEVESLTAKCESLKLEVIRTQGDSQIIVDEFEKLKISEAELKKSIEVLENKIAVNKKEFEETLASERNTFETVQKNLESEMNQLRDNLSTAKMQLEKLNKEKEATLETSTDKEKIISTLEAKITKHEEQEQQLISQLTDQRLQLNRLEDEKLTLQRKIAEKTEELNSVLMEKNNASTREENYREGLNKKTKEYLETVKQLEMTEKERQVLSETVKLLQEHIEEERRKVDDLHRSENNLKQELAKVLSEKTSVIKMRDIMKQKYEDDLRLQMNKYAVAEEKLKKLEELSANNYKIEQQLKAKMIKLEKNLQISEQKCKQIELKSQPVAAIEKKLSGLELSTLSQISSTVQESSTNRATLNDAENAQKLAKPTYTAKRKPHVRKDEILSTKKIKSILKPETYQKSPKSPAKKITFSSTSQFDFDDSDDQSLNEKNGAGDNNKINKLIQSLDNSPEIPALSSQKSTASQESVLGTPTKKFFKSKGN